MGDDPERRVRFTDAARWAANLLTEVEVEQFVAFRLILEEE